MKRLFPIPACLFVVLWLALMTIGRSSLFRDPGTFWHTVLGEQMLQTGELVRHDSLTFTHEGERWLALQWLGEITMAAAHRLGGWDTELLLAATVLAFTYSRIANRFLRIGVEPVLTLVLLLLVLGTGSHHFHVRPHLATMLLMGVTAALLVDIENGRRSLVRLWWLAPIFVLWTNIHGGVMAGLATVYLTAFGWSAALLIGWPSPLRTLRDMAHLTGCLVAVTAALFVNPYGTEMPTQWLSIMTMNLPEMIQEHAPLSLQHVEGWMVSILVVVYGGVLLTTFPQRPRGVWLLPLVWGVLAFSRVRHAPLFGIVTAIMLADVLPQSRIWEWLKKREFIWPVSTDLTHRLPTWRYVWLPLVVVSSSLALQMAGAKIPVVGRDWVRFDSTYWPVGLLDELKKLEAEPGASGRIVNSLGYGGFLQYHTPKLKPYIDDRCELFGESFLGDYVDAEGQSPAKLELWSTQHNCRHALVAGNGSFDEFLKRSPNWRLISRDAAAALYQRTAPATH